MLYSVDMISTFNMKHIQEIFIDIKAQYPDKSVRV